MNSTFCGVNADATSTSTLPSLSSSFLALVSMVRTVPVLTEYASSSTGSPFASFTTLPFASTFLTQFLRSRPIPPVTPTVVRKIGAIPLVPATTGRLLMNGMYGEVFSPAHSATLFTPDIREEPTPMVPFSAISITLASGLSSPIFLISC